MKDLTPEEAEAYDEAKRKYGIDFRMLENWTPEDEERHRAELAKGGMYRRDR